MTRIVACFFSVGIVVTGVGVAFAQDYPSKPVRIVTAPAGGATDFMSRAIAPGLSASLGQSVLVDNRPQIFVTPLVAKSPSDGYTLLLGSGSHWVGPLLLKLTYDPVKDFAPVSTIARQPNVLVVHPSLPVKSVNELVVLAKARPGEINYTTSSVGSSSYLGSELFRSMTGVNMVRVAYSGGGPSLNALLGGEVQLLFTNPSSVSPHVKSGRLRALAVTSAEPSELVPGLPTMAASGLPGFESVSTYVVFAPAKTPAAITNRLNREIVRVVNLPDVKERFLNSGVESVGSTPEQLTATMTVEMAQVSKMLKEGTIKGE